MDHKIEIGVEPKPRIPPKSTSHKHAGNNVIESNAIEPITH